jgi:hypothetical protein
MQEPHPTFVLHNGFFRIDSDPLKTMSSLDHVHTEGTSPAAF